MCHAAMFLLRKKKIWEVINSFGALLESCSELVTKKTQRGKYRQTFHQPGFETLLPGRRSGEVSEN